MNIVAKIIKLIFSYYVGYVLGWILVFSLLAIIGGVLANII
jgi:hypothetical protein